MGSNTRDTWIDAAYRRFTESGLSSVRVESLAREIDATKGSFYWHFRDRGELVAAVMERWERAETEQVIDLAEGTHGRPQERLATLFELVGARLRERGGERTLYTEAQAEGVLDVVARVTQRRIDYVAGLLGEIGVENAPLRAAIAISTAIGMQQLVTGGWEPKSPDELLSTMLRQALAP